MKFGLSDKIVKSRILKWTYGIKLHIIIIIIELTLFEKLFKLICFKRYLRSKKMGAD